MRPPTRASTVAVVALVVAISTVPAGAAGAVTAADGLDSLANDTDSTLVNASVSAGENDTDGTLDADGSLDDASDSLTDGDALLEERSGDDSDADGSTADGSDGDGGTGDADRTQSDDAATLDVGGSIDAAALLAIDANLSTDENGSSVGAALATNASGDGVGIAVDASLDANGTLSTNATLDGRLVDALDVDDLLGEDPNGSAAGPASGDGSGTGSDGGDGPVPDAEDAGAGLAVGSLLVGGGILARRFAETSLLTGGAGGGGGGGSLLSAAFAWLRAWGWRVLALAGYQRFDGSDPLEHDTRAAVYERVESEPGIFLSELAESTDVPMSTLRYHLRILAHEDLITSEKVRGKRRYAPRESEPDPLDPALADDATAAVLEAVAREPDSVSGLADRLDRDPSTVTHHLQRLDEEGLVEREREGRSVVTRLADGIDRTQVAAATAGYAD